MKRGLVFIVNKKDFNEIWCWFMTAMILKQNIAQYFNVEAKLFEPSM